MQNPWERLPNTPPFILPEDEDLIHIHNNKYQGTPYEVFLCDEIPSPYIGDPKASVVLLNLNPGYSPNEKNSQNLTRFQEIAKANLLHQFYEYPYYVLDPSLGGTPSGYAWFMQKLGPIMQAANLTAQELSKKIFTVEYFPYHSIKYGWQSGVLPSQKYAINLIEEAIIREAIVIIMRGKNIWMEAIPELIEYPKVYVLNSPQNVIISKNNLGEKHFNVIVEKLREK